MRFRKRFFLGIIFIFIAASAHAQESYNTGHLTEGEIQRLKAVKVLLYGVDKKSLQATIEEVEKARDPQISLQMKEAMARAYTDIVKEINVQGQQKKEWLYSMVCLNMAYLQFGGSQGKYGSTTELNRLIRRKLTEYLPPNALKQPGFVYSLE
jgi:hypothetical protein